MKIHFHNRTLTYFTAFLFYNSSKRIQGIIMFALINSIEPQIWLICLSMLLLLLFISWFKMLRQQRQHLQLQSEHHYLQQRLQEKLDELSQNNTQLKQREQSYQQLQQFATDIKSQYAGTVAQANSFKQQLAQAQQTIEQRELTLQQQQQEQQRTLQELTTLKTTLAQRERQFIEQQQTIEQSKQQLTTEFQNLANRILEEKSQRFQQHNQIALNDLLKPFREQIDSFQKRVNEVHSEALKGHTVLESEIKKVLDIGLAMSQEANNLTSALKGSKKITGTWGEIQLANALQLAGLIENEHYTSQEVFKDSEGNRRQPDFIVKLPDDKHLIIDSKMSLIAYESAVNAEQSHEQQHFLSEHVKAIRQHVNDLAQKDYSNLIGMRSPNFVLMFISLEPAYIEALKTDRQLFNDAYNKNVIIVSHTTLMPILRTVANLWRIERGNNEAQEISAKAGELYNQVSVVAERLQKLGNTLSTVNNHYNHTVTALVGNQGLYGKVERFKTLSAKVTKALPDIEPLQTIAEHERLNITMEYNL